MSENIAWIGGFTINGGEPVEIAATVNKKDAFSRACEHAVRVGEQLQKIGLTRTVEAWVQEVHTEVITAYEEKEVVGVY